MVFFVWSIILCFAVSITYNEKLSLWIKYNFESISFDFIVFHPKYIATFTIGQLCCSTNIVLTTSYHNKKLHVVLFIF